jgi:KDO2-lipid IV(A) lauroyltransferase
MPQSVSDWTTDAGYGAAWKLVRTLPAPMAKIAFDQAADAAVRRGGKQIDQFRKNLARVCDPHATGWQLDQMVRDGMRSYARYWLETFRLPAMNKDKVLANCSTEGVENLDAALARGKGVILALPHSGNWDVAGLWLVNHGYPFATVAERLKPESLFDKFVAYRQGIGMEVLPLTGGDRPPLEVLAERLRDGNPICLVADRDLSRNGIEVTFFGEKTRMPAGPAYLAATTGATLLPVHVWFDGPGWAQWIGAPIDLGSGEVRDQVKTGTQALADIFAQRIALRPTDWHMLQKLWLADLDPGRAPASERPDVVPLRRASGR